MSRKFTTDTYLRQLTRVNNDLKNAFDFELEKLKDQERELQEALRLKTRIELLSTLEKELQMKDLSELDNDDLDRVNTRSNFLSSQIDATRILPVNDIRSTMKSGDQLSATNMSRLSTRSLDDLIQLSDESLIKSYAVMDKLNRSGADRTTRHLLHDTTAECEICEYPMSSIENRSPIDTQEFLKKTVYSNLGNTRNSIGFYNNPEPVRPNVVSVLTKLNKYF